MRVDVHGHFTTAPPALDAYRGRQTSMLNRPVRGKLAVSDGELADALQPVLDQMAERAIDVILFSPRAAGMGHDLGDARVSRYWTEINNDLIARACAMVPDRLLPVCQLPQTPAGTPADLRDELQRCADLGFVGCLVNPDVTAGIAPWTPPMSDAWWDPLWATLVELEMPAMIHAAATVNPAMHLHASHYLSQHHAAAFELATSTVFTRFPDLVIVIPHGGGAIPYQFNRMRATQVLAGATPFEDGVRHLYFDTSLYDTDSLEMLVRKIGVENVLFGSEMFGTAKAVDPTTGRTFDDVIPMLESIPWLGEADRSAIYEGNVRRVYRRAARRLAATRGPA